MELLDEGDVRSLLAFLDTLDAPAPPPALEDAEPRAEPVRSPAHGASSGESPRSPSESERSSSSAGSPSSGSSDSIGQGPAAPQQQQVKKKKKKRNPATSSTALQRRKREEIQALRDESAALEQQLRQLKRVHAAGAAAQSAAQSVVGAKRRAGPARSVWQELAILQARERHRAEITNRKLKAVLANQQEVNDALQGLVGKRSVLQVRSARARPMENACTNCDHSFFARRIWALYSTKSPCTARQSRWTALRRSLICWKNKWKRCTSAWSDPWRTPRPAQCRPRPSCSGHQHTAKRYKW